jgi:ectoine utilization protein EutC
MPQIKILTEAELRQSTRLNRDLHDIIEQAFAALDNGGVIMPPVLSMDIAEKNGEVDVKTAYVPGLDAFAIKISPGFFDNPALGLPSLSGLMILFDSNTGIVKSLLLDNGYLTDIRTAAAGGIAARYLAPQQVDTLGIVGTGMQARLQLQSFLLERTPQRVLVWGRSSNSVTQFVENQSEALGINIQASDSIQQLVEQSQAIVTTTPARENLIKSEWLHPCLHITAMGSDSPEKHELEPDIITKADYFVVDRVQQSKERGELRMALEQGLVQGDGVFDELAGLCSGRLAGRTAEDQVTVCDLTGTGIQDTAVANYAFTQASQLNLGTVIES